MLLLNEVAEYDIEHAGPSIYYVKNVISKKEYERLISLPKEKRNVQTGLMEKENSSWFNIKKAGYKEYTDLFIEKNNLMPHHIVERVNDAVWVNGVAPRKRVFGGVKFRKKRVFDIMFVYERKNVRFYLNVVTGQKEVRGGHWNTSSKLNRQFWTILTMFENGSNKIYNKIHRIINKLKSNELAYGEELLRGVKNITLMKSLLREVVI